MIDKNEFRKYAIHNQGVSGTAVDDYANHIENMTQYVIEERPGNFRAIDVFTRLISDRIIFLGMGVDDQIANIITAQLLFLESTDPKRDIVMYINSPGGSVYAGLGMYDTMQYISPDVATDAIKSILAPLKYLTVMVKFPPVKRNFLPEQAICLL